MEFGIVKRKELSDLAEKTYEEISNIPYKNRDSDKFGLALKALDESRYSLNDSEIRNWFSKLVSTSVDDRNNSSLTPYYSTVLSNMNGDAAKFLTNFKNIRIKGDFTLCPVVKIIKNTDQGGSIDVYKNLFYWDYLTDSFNSDNFTYDMFPSYFESVEDSILNVLSSFNIINITYDKFGTYESAKKAYDFFEHCETLKNIRLENALHHNPNIDLSNIDLDNIPYGNEIQIKKGAIYLTDFGKSFIKAAMPI